MGQQLIGFQHPQLPAILAWTGYQGFDI
jgi:hypothetical protein